MLRALIPLVLFAITSQLTGGPRDAEWKQVEQLIEPTSVTDPFAGPSPAEFAKGQDDSIKLGALLEKIQVAAFAEQSWKEGARALVLRLGQQNIYEDGVPNIIRMLDDGIRTVSAETKAILRCLLAHYYAIYYRKNEQAFATRSATTVSPGGDFETWDLTRIVQQIDLCFQEALADPAITRKIPIADFAPFLENPALDDATRPMLYDFIVHEALQFSLLREFIDPIPAANAFEIAADSPVFGSADEFLLWKPATQDKESPALRALHLYQDLLSYHKNDPEPTAFLHCDLERLRWGYLVAQGPQRAKRFEAAIQSFIGSNAKHPVSADARLDIINILLKMKNPKDARDVARLGADAFPDHPFGQRCRDHVNDIERKKLDLNTESHWTPAGGSIRIKHANVAHVWFRAYRQDWTPDLAAEEPYVKTASLGFLKTKPELAWDAALPDDKDFKHHDTPVPAPQNLSPGYYLIVASGNSDFSTDDNKLASARVYVTNLFLLVDNKVNRKLSGFVVDALTGRPLNGIQVEIWQRNWKSPARIMPGTATDPDGYFSISTHVTENQVIIAARNGDNRAVTCFQNGSSDNRDQPTTIVPKEIEENVHLVTDRAVYRPGQTIQFKGILSESNKAKASYKILTGRPVTAVLSGPKQQEIGKIDAVTNEYGSFSGTFTAPGGSLLGEYNISVAGKDETGILVEEYKRPKFHVTLSPPEASPELDKPTAIPGKAETFTGSAVNGAMVKWSVSRGTRWADCWNDYYGYWGMPDSRVDSADITGGTLVTAADGSFAIPFTAKASRSVEPEIEPVFCFTVEVEVIDLTGETRKAEYTLPVGYASMSATLVTDDWQEVAKPVIFKVHTASLDGTKNLPASGMLRIYQFTVPDTFGLVCGKIIRGEAPGELIREVPVKTDNSGLAEIPVALPVGRYLAIFITQDTNGHQVRTLGEVTVIQPASDKFPLKTPFLTISPCWKVQPGQPFTLLWGSGYPNACARIDWFKDDVLLKREWSTPGRTQQVFSYTPDESMRGGFTVCVTQTTMNHLQTFAKTIEVPWSNKELTIRWEHLTSKLAPGAKDSWTAVITGPEGQAAAAEMVATLYDASLDSIAEHGFYGLNLRREPYCSSYYPNQSSSYLSFAESGNWKRTSWPLHDQNFYRKFKGLPNDYNPWQGAGSWSILGRLQSNYDYAPPEHQGISYPCSPATPPALGAYSDPSVTQVTARRNLQETAFFYPHLTSNEQGEVRITFTMPEALTQWKFLGFAHDKAMRSGLLEGVTVTAKDLMVQPNPPRFLREGDALDFTVKITNQSEREQTGVAGLTLADARTQKDATAALGITDSARKWAIPAKESRTLSWHITVPDGTDFLTYKALASSGALSDGEEGWLPVIPRRVMLTESLALPIRDAGTKNYSFQKLLDSHQSTTLENRLLDVQVVSQPAWYAVMALPYLMEFPHEGSEQTFNRYYANALARHVATSNPKIRRIFELWKNTPALDSPLTKNADVKGILLEETPWLSEAGETSQARRNLGLLFDDNRLENELEAALKKLGDLQQANGLWPWFPGGHGNEYISLYIATGFARLRAVGMATNITPALKTLPALDAMLTERFAAIKQTGEKDPKFLTANHLDPWIAHHLYTRTFFLKDAAVKRADQQAFDYFTAQAKRFWPGLDSRMSRAHVALALARLGDPATAKSITRSFKEHAVIDDLAGMSWKDHTDENWWWWQAPIETQAMMIEAFREVDHDAMAVDACRVWLIHQKQARDWHTTTATADAIHALLMGGGDLLGSDALLQISLGGIPVKPDAVEPGTGFYEFRITGSAIKPEMGAIQLTQSGPGIAWAGVHWQYLEDLAKVTEHNATPVKLEKTLYIRTNTPQGSKLDPVRGPVKVGDELVTRLVLRNERAMEFMHLKDLRGSGTEPVNVLSGYRWQDGFGYYEVTRDTASHFFIDTLPAGTHVFESSVRVQHAGQYQTGIAEIRCMYAPEFNAHSASVMLEVTR